MIEIVPLSMNGPMPGSGASDDGMSARGGVITIGNFDGVHLGHAALLREVRRMADELSGPAVAVILDPHPASILRPESSVPKLTGIPRRAELMGELGIDTLVVVETTPDLLRMTAGEFFQWLVIDRLRARVVIEGPNFFFGRDRGGDVQVLGQLCEASGVGLRIVEPTNVDGRMISSTRIRKLLEVGSVEEAAELLGIAYRLRGRVAAGDRRGRRLGFPTANLDEIDVVIPAAGVYGGVATIVAGGQQGGHRPSYQAAIHIGPNPTFDNHQDFKVEIHLLDYDGDLYEQTLLVDLIVRVRDIARFESADRLVEQLDRDINTIRQEVTRPNR